MQATIIPLFLWSGVFSGFLVDGCLFDAGGVYLGWEDTVGRVWYRDGSYLGQRLDENYVLQRTGFASPVPQPRRVPPVTPELPLPPANRAARPPRPGWSDALARFNVRPTSQDLVGAWRNAQERMLLRSDGRYELTTADRSSLQGEWELRGNLLLTPAADADADSAPDPAAGPDTPATPRRLVFRVLAYDVQTLTLRRITDDRSLPFTMERVGTRSVRPF